MHRTMVTDFINTDYLLPVIVYTLQIKLKIASINVAMVG